MLNEEQLAAEVKITGATAWILLQCISRLTTTGAVKDIELTAVGGAHDTLVASLQEATGVNYDQAKAQMEAMQRQRVAEARAAAQKAQEAQGEDGAAEDAPAPAEASADAEGATAAPAA